MRFIGNLPDELAATTFGDVLRSLGIEYQIESEPSGGRWTLWVRSEDDVEPARERLTAFLEDPARPEFVVRAREGAVQRRLMEDATADAAELAGGDGAVLRRMFPHGVGALTAVLAGICLAIACAAWAGYGGQVFDQLLITRMTPEGRGIRWNGSLPEIFEQGEFWRLLTPALVHFNVAHLLLNLLWLIDLGSAIENRQGAGRLGLLFVTIAIGSNLAQTWWGGPAFCGVSGVLFGLLGYMWMKGRFDPESGLALHPYTVVLMLVFFSFAIGGGFSALFGISMANGAHAAGLLMGILFGLATSLPALRRRWKRLP